MSDNKELNPSEIEEIKSNFDFFDKDHNGEIDLDEFTELLRVLSPKSSNIQAADGFSFIDSNNDGHIDFDEFIAWWKTCWWEY